jgi:hypothetical protein
VVTHISEELAASIYTVNILNSDDGDTISLHAVKIVTFIREVLGSKHSEDTDYLD